MYTRIHKMQKRPYVSLKDKDNKEKTHGQGDKNHRFHRTQRNMNTEIYTTNFEVSLIYTKKKKSVTCQKEIVSTTKYFGSQFREKKNTKCIRHSTF